ncbi:MAG: GMP synthase (glutamine-hydrolyzing) [Trizodia sp. TS-e1964]|nr:MAG: GMP synthase (glutamine-hydrolyzing) [Trizodia sp. TS-e1964]
MTALGEHDKPIPPPPSSTFDTILVLDFGSQTTQLITRRLREHNVYAEMLPCTQKMSELSWKPKGIILSGGPNSVYLPDAPHADPAVFELGVPILGICYGLQEIAWHHGKNVLAGEKEEYGQAKLNVERHQGKENNVNGLFHGLKDDMIVWMSHGDKLSHLPPSFHTIATTLNAPFAGIAHDSKPLYGIQFHPEVTHTPHGSQLIKNFAIDICEARNHWTMETFIDREIARIKALVGEKGQVLGAISGGVDSTVAAKLMQAAIGDRFHGVLVDNGLMRLNEVDQVETTLTKHLGIKLTVVRAGDRFLTKLKGISDPEQKRKIIGNEFGYIFKEKAAEIAKAAAGSPREGEIEWLLQGTLYPDVIESVSFKGPSATIKTHHNVGGLPKDLGLRLIEPLRELFKDEARALGTKLGIPEELVWRHPFPGPGIGIRVLGEVTPEQVRIAQEADHIFIEEIKSAGLYREISQAYAALNPTRVVGVMGDKRVYAQQITLRAVQTTDFMTANIFRFDYDFLDRSILHLIDSDPAWNHGAAGAIQTFPALPACPTAVMNALRALPHLQNLETRLDSALNPRTNANIEAIMIQIVDSVFGTACRNCGKGFEKFVEALDALIVSPAAAAGSVAQAINALPVPNAFGDQSPPPSPPLTRNVALRALLTPVTNVAGLPPGFAAPVDSNAKLLALVEEARPARLARRACRGVSSSSTDSDVEMDDTADEEDPAVEPFPALPRLRNGEKRTNQGLNLVPNSNLEAVMIQMVGAINQEPCGHYARKCGKFVACISVSGLFGGRYLGPKATPESVAKAINDLLVPDAFGDAATSPAPAGPRRSPRRAFLQPVTDLSSLPAGFAAPSRRFSVPFVPPAPSGRSFAPLLSSWPALHSLSDQFRPESGIWVTRRSRAERQHALARYHEGLSARTQGVYEALVQNMARTQQIYSALGEMAGIHHEIALLHKEDGSRLEENLEEYC